MSVKELSEELNKLSIQTVASWVGVRLPLKGTVRCPFPDHPDKTPSFDIRPSGTRWICYSCHRSGGSIDFIQTYQGWNFVTARDWLAEKAGMRTAGKTYGKPRPIEAKSTASIETVATEAPADAQLYGEFLRLCPLKDEGKAYLHARGITDGTISAARAGQIGTGASAIRELIQKYDFERVSSSGLLTKASPKSNPRCIFPDGSVLFPYFENDQITYFQSRHLGNIQKENKWRNLNHRRRRTFKIQVDTPSRPLAICEGVIDALSAYELHYDAWGLIGVSAELEVEEIKHLRSREVHILLDWDSAGEKKAKSLQAELRRLGVSSVRKKQPMPSVKDLNEYLMKKRGLS